MYVPLHFIDLLVRRSIRDLFEVDPFRIASMMRYFKQGCPDCLH